MEQRLALEVGVFETRRWFAVADVLSVQYSDVIYHLCGGFAMLGYIIRSRAIVGQ